MSILLSVGICSKASSHRLGAVAGSLALVGFGFDSLIEVSSGAALAWRLHLDAPEQRERAEARALKLVGICFIALAAYVSFDSAKSLLRHEAPNKSYIGIVITVISLVAAAALLLVQEGKLNPDEKIERLLGDEKWFGQLPNAKDITPRMLLNHSSGIQNHVDSGGFMRSLFKSSTARDIRYEELIAYVLNKKPLFAAGKGFNYSDTNYVLVGLIVEKAAGRNLYDEITERILKPLKLDRTIPSNRLTLPDVANGYFQNKPVIVGGRFIINPQWEWAGGGFASTAEDLARWAKALYAGDVLQKKSLDEMLNSTTMGEGAGYGLGVEIVKSKWGKSYGHDGEFPGYLSVMRYFPNYKIAVAVQVNSDETPDVDRFLVAVDDFAQIIIQETSSRKLPEADQTKLRELTENWLKLFDTGKFAESWEELSAGLKAKYAKEKWQSALQPLLSKVGKIKTRRFRAIYYSDPEAEKVAVDFESSFTKLSAGSETVILELEKDGKWHVESYSIR